MIDVEPFIKEVLEKKIPEENLRFFGEDNEDVWKEKYLNEKDIDLLDLCLFYQYIGEEIEVLGYWVTGHGGGTYEEFEATKGTLEVLKPKMQAFVNRCYERYEEVMQEYIEAPERFKKK